MDYKPLKTFHEKQNLSSKAQLTTYSHFTTIKNTRVRPVVVKVIDQLPQSVDEKITVKLITPENLSSANASMNDDHNIEWMLNIPPGETIEIPFTFSVDL